MKCPNCGTLHGTIEIGMIPELDPNPPRLFAEVVDGDPKLRQLIDERVGEVTAKPEPAPCARCGNPIGNPVFTVCDDCWPTPTEKESPAAKTDHEKALEMIATVCDYCLEGSGHTLIAWIGDVAGAALRHDRPTLISLENQMRRRGSTT